MWRPRLCWPWGTRRRSAMPRPSRRFGPSSAGGRRRPRRRNAGAQAPRRGQARRGTHMGRTASPRGIGAFVVGGIALVMAGVIFFGGGKVFQEKTPYVLFFEGSVQGLHVGAPVVFRGVQVGQVTKVEALYAPTQATIHVKVRVELVPDAVQVTAEVRQRSPHEVVEFLVHQGLRASLQLQSFVTGLLLVSLDFYPDTPIKRLGLDPTYPELPTVPSQIEQLLRDVRQAVATLGKLPLEALLAEALGTLTQAHTLLETPELRQALVALPALVTDAR